MAEEILGKKISDLPEKTEPVDTDVYVFGDAGTNVLKKAKWSNMLSKIVSKLAANNLTTTIAGYFLDARQGKALKDSIDELNTNKISKADIISGSINGVVALKNGTGQVTLNAKKDGYTAKGVVGWSISSTWHVPSAVSFNPTDQTVSFTVRHVNDATSSGNINVYTTILYVKN